ncbi:MAG: response regulator transcription factor [Bacteroidetes bacterium]|nr:response regulator transcription factor [Bacteroidota bacterium]
MTVIIIEDEKLSADYLARLLHKLDPKIEVLAVIDSIEQCVNQFSNGLTADLIFLDIHLADGISFDLFNRIDISTPIIFTTAFSDYAIKAFEVNSIDYLLKPIGLQDLKRALDKFAKLNARPNDELLAQLKSAFQQAKPVFKNRFLVKMGQSIDSIPVEEILHFMSSDGLTFLVNRQGKRFSIDYQLEQLESLLSPDMFFRINRKVILSLKSINKVSIYTNSRLIVQAPSLEGEACIVSRERTQDFKSWLDK